MNKLCTATALATLFLSSISFAADDATSTAPVMGGNDDASCKVVVKACKAGGFERDKEGKGFWKDCMHPLLLGQTVSGVTVDAAQVKACRDKKIASMQNLLTELQGVK